MVSISGFHREGPGLTPGVGTSIYFNAVKTAASKVTDSCMLKFMLSSEEPRISLFTQSRGKRETGACLPVGVKGKRKHGQVSSVMKTAVHKKTCRQRADGSTIGADLLSDILGCSDLTWTFVAINIFIYNWRKCQRRSFFLTSSFFKKPWQDSRFLDIHPGNRELLNCFFFFFWKWWQ